jgi:hypothetical protein
VRGDPGGGGTIDNGAACLELGGDPQYWRDEAVGQGGSLVWTNATEFAEPSNYAIWRLVFAQAGEYALRRGSSRRSARPSRRSMSCTTRR